MTKDEIPTDFRAFRLMVPILVKIWGTVFAYSFCLVLLESYSVGYLLGVGGTVTFSALINFYHFKDFVKDKSKTSNSSSGKIGEESYWNILSEQEKTANYFGQEFFKE